MSKKQTFGPYVKKLIAHRISVISTTDQPMEVGKILLKPSLEVLYERAVRWVKTAIDVVKISPDNMLGDNDERIAAEILRVVGNLKHNWIRRPELEYDTCEMCGIIRRRDGQNANSLCKGPTKVVIR